MSITPDWNKVALEIGDNLNYRELNIAWAEACDNWLSAMATEFGNDYKVIDSSNFAIMSNENERYNSLFSAFLERTLKRILATLKGIASDEGFGKHVAIIFKNSEQYYEYVGLFYPDTGDFGLSSGMYINDGYGHFVFPSQELDYAEPTAVHELTHACLDHLPIPLWLNEGIAVLMEEKLAGKDFYIDQQVVAQHHEYWTTETIQEFWSGESFHAIDEGQELSYHLAHLLTRNIFHNFSSYADFINAANFEDAGEDASKKYLGISLSYLVGTFLGDGDWTPLEKNTQLLPQF
jgi:hypothetical protein